MENIVNNYFLILAVFLSVTFLGFYLAYLYGRKTLNFRWIEYIGILIAPTLFTIFLAYLYGEKIIELYFISAVFGFWLEYIIGLSYHKTLNKRLWIYQRYSVEGYTSYLTLPIWGFGGILFWLLGKTLG